MKKQVLCLLPQCLTNFEIQKYYRNNPTFNSVYSRNNLPKMKYGAYVINLDQYKSIGTYWIALYVNGNDIIYFDSFAVEHTPKEIKKFIKKQKYHNKHVKNTSIRFDNVRTLLN